MLYYPAEGRNSRLLVDMFRWIFRVKICYTKNNCWLRFGIDCRAMMIIISGAVFMGPPPVTAAAGVSSFKNENYYQCSIRYNEKKRSEATQTLHVGCTIRLSQKFSPRRRPPSRGAGRPKFNQLEVVTTFTYRPNLVKIDTRNFELSW